MVGYPVDHRGVGSHRLCDSFSHGCVQEETTAITILLSGGIWNAGTASACTRCKAIHCSSDASFRASDATSIPSGIPPCSSSSTRPTAIPASGSLAAACSTCTADADTAAFFRIHGDDQCTAQKRTGRIDRRSHHNGAACRFCTTGCSESAFRTATRGTQTLIYKNPARKQDFL